MRRLVDAAHSLNNATMNFAVRADKQVRRKISP